MADACTSELAIFFVIFYNKFLGGVGIAVAAEVHAGVIVPDILGGNTAAGLPLAGILQLPSSRGEKIHEDLIGRKFPGEDIPGDTASFPDTQPAEVLLFPACLKLQAPRFV